MGDRVTLLERPSIFGETSHLTALVGELSQTWRGRALEADRLARLPAKTIEDCRSNGLFSLCVPKRFGGMALHWDELAELTLLAAKGCPATSWMIGLVGSHAAMIARMNDLCQYDVFGASPHCLVATASVQRHCDVVRKKDELVVSGMWSISSGVEFSDWVILYLRNSNLGQNPWLAVVPVEDVEIVDDWDVIGLRATASKSVKLSSVTVPAHRLMVQSECFDADPPGAKLNPEAIHYAAPYLPFLSSAILNPVIGTTIGGLETACDLLRSRYARLAPDSAERVSLELAVAESQAELRSAQFLMTSCLRILKSSEMRSVGTKGYEACWVQLRRDKAYSVKLCSKAMGRLINSLGTLGLFAQTLPQLYWRDLNAMSKHMDVHWSNMMRPSGQFTLEKAHV